jgi:sulfur carrier protein ThiS
MRLRILLLLVFGWMLVSAGAHAQSSQLSRDSEKLKVAADEAMDNLRYAEALDGYTKAYAISHDARFLYNMGRALGALGQYPEAVNQLERFRLDAPADLKSRVPQLEQLITDFKRHVSTLTIKCNVTAARVLVREKAVGQTPLAELKLNAGPAVVEVDADGYATQRQQVTLPEGDSIELVFDLVKASPLGILVVRSTPAATSVFVDGKGLGGTPLETSLMPGPHVLLLGRDGYRDLTTSAVIERGRRRELDLRLEKTPSVLTRWWFWTVVGVVIASGVAIGIAATTERPADMGTIPPYQVRGP